MLIEELKQKVQNRTARLAVVGLGYVGLPVASLFAEADFDVIGLDIKPERVEKINAGISPIEGDEPGFEELLKKVSKSRKLNATTDYNLIKDCDVILIDVETPVDEQNVPRYEALRAALHSLGGVLKPGALVIVESTIAPGTMQKIVCPLLEKGSGRKVNNGFYLGNCPERVMPGKLISNLRSLGRAVGGGTPETASTMIELYRHIVKADLDAVDWTTAELVKTVENAYRDVQIAFANEVARICEALGSNVWKVRELVNKSPSREMHFPGAGVGGHCIPKDPWLLAYGVEGTGVPLRLIPAARMINDDQPLHMVELMQHALKEGGGNLKGARILVMGYAYLEESDDTRNSPSEKLLSRLKHLGAIPVVHDPFVHEFQGNILQMAKGCDAAIAMVAHKAYKNLDLKLLKSALLRPILVDGRHIFNADQLRADGWIFRGVGV